MTLTKKPPETKTALSSHPAEPSAPLGREKYDEAYRDRAIEEILAEFGSAAAQVSPAASEEPPSEYAKSDIQPESHSAKPEAVSLVIDGIDFSEFLSDQPVSQAATPRDDHAAEKPAAEKASKASKAEQTAQPQKQAVAAQPVSENEARPQIRRRPSAGSVMLLILAFAAVLATVLFLYTQTLQDKVSGAGFEDVRKAVLDELTLDDMQLADAQMVRRLYGFAPSDFEDCTLYYPATNMGAREVLLVKLSDLSQQKSVADAIETRKQTQMKSFEGYGIEQYDLLSRSVTEVQGNYILFVVHENAAAARQAFLKAL